MASSVLRVQLLNLAGKVLDIELDPEYEATIGSLKHKIASSEWHIPSKCQQLLHQGAVVEYDKEHVAAYCDSSCNSIVSLVLLVSLTTVRNDLESDSMKDKKMALRQLAYLGAPGGPDALSLASKYIGHADVGVRSSAVEAMTCIAACTNNMGAMRQVASCLDDSHSEVQMIAATSLAKFAGEGPADTAETNAVSAEVIPRLSSSKSSVRQAAVRALAGIAVRGGKNAIVLIVACLEDIACCVRNETVKALAEVAKVAGKINRDVTAAAIQRLGHPSFFVREATVEALEQIVQPGDDFAFLAIVEYMQHPEEGVRATAAKALRQVFQACAHNDERAVMVLFQCLKEPNTCVRIETLKSLASIACKDHRMVLPAVLKCLEDPEEIIKSTAVRALTDLAEKSNTFVIQSLFSCLSDRFASVRRESLAALETLTPKGDVQTISQVANCLEDADMAVRQAAVRAFAYIAEKSDPHAMAAVTARFNHPVESARLAALAAFPRVVERGDKQVLLKIAELLEDPLTNIRWAAVRALAAGSEIGDECAIAALLERLKDHAEIVRLAGLEALLHVTLPGDAVVIDAVERFMEKDRTAFRGRVAALTVLAKLKAEQIRAP